VEKGERGFGRGQAGIFAGCRRRLVKKTTRMAKMRQQANGEGEGEGEGGIKG
jgi:hypothetical protein